MTVTRPPLGCGRARKLLVLTMDGPLDGAGAAWLSEHLEACAECSRRQSQFRQVDWELTAFGKELHPHGAPQLPLRTALAARLAAAPEPPPVSPLRWLPAVALTAAAAIIASVAPPPTHLSVSANEPKFIPIPYVEPLGRYESGTIVAMNIPIGELIAAGYRIPADPTLVVPAEVLVGEDGRAHAIRLPSALALQPEGEKP